jgi:peroxiredoxin
MWLRALSVALAVAVVGVACGPAEPGGSGGLAAVAPVERPDVIPELRFHGPTVSDGTLELPDLAGKPVVFWFWASSCTECAKQADTAAVFSKMAGDDASVVGVTCGSQESAAIFEEQHDLTFPTLMDQDGTLTNALGIACQQAWVFVSPDGTSEMVPRALDLDELSSYLEQAGGPALL